MDPNKFNPDSEPLALIHQWRNGVRYDMRVVYDSMCELKPVLRRCKANAEIIKVVAKDLSRVTAISKNDWEDMIRRVLRFHEG